MLASKKSETIRLLFELAIISLIWILGDWVFRGRGRNVHQILIDSIPYVIGATTVNVWHHYRQQESSRKIELASKS